MDGVDSLIKESYHGKGKSSNKSKPEENVVARILGFIANRVQHSVDGSDVSDHAREAEESGQKAEDSVVEGQLQEV